MQEVKHVLNEFVFFHSGPDAGNPIASLASDPLPSSTPHYPNCGRIGKQRGWTVSLPAILACCLLIGLPGFGTAQAAQTPALTMSAGSVVFGSVTVNTAATPKTVTLTSSGTAPLVISAASIAGSGAFGMSGVTFPLTLNPGQAATLTVTFDASTAGAKSANLTMTTNAPAGEAVIALSGTAVGAPGLTLSATSVAFGAVLVNTAAPAKKVTLTSSGTAPLIISAGTLSAAPAFGMSGVSFPLTLNPGQTATLTLSFDSNTTGLKTGTLTLTTNTSAGLATVAVRGTGIAPALTLNTSSLAFGVVDLNTKATPRTVTVTSSGTAPLTINTGSITGAAAFEMSGVTFPITLNPGQTATLAVSFDPNTPGLKTATVALSTNASPAMATVAVQGTGATPTLMVSTSSLSFGVVQLNTAPPPQTVKLSSIGTNPVTISGATLSGSAGFGISGVSFPLTLNPGQSATLTVSFDPSTSGLKTGTLTLTSNSTAEPSTIAVRGTGATPALTLSTTSLAFGDVLVNTAAVPKTVTLYSSGTGPVTISGATISGAPAFGMSGLSFPLTLNPGQTATLTLSFDSNTAGLKTGTVTLTTNAGPETIAVQGTGAAPALTLSASTVSFGEVAVNTKATPQTVELYSSGTAPLTISAATVGGAAAFGMTGLSFPLTLNPGQTATLTLTFDASGLGPKTGSVTLTTNAAGSTMAIALSGAAVAPGVLTGVSCGTGSITGAGTVACGVTLSSPAGPGGQTVALTSSNSAVTVPASVMVAAGASSAAFTATVTAVTTAQTATLTASSGGTNATYAISLGAATPALTVGSSTVAFGDVSLNTSATQSVILTSSGTAALTISKGTVQGSGFGMTGLSFPLTLNPGSSATMEVEFDPTTSGSATGAVTLTTNTSAGSASIALTGTGQAASYEVQLSWVAPTNPSVPIAGYYVYREVSGASSYQQLNSTADASTTYTDTSVANNTTYSYYVESVDSQGNVSAPSNPFTVTIP